MRTSLNTTINPKSQLAHVVILVCRLTVQQVSDLIMIRVRLVFYLCQFFHLFSKISISNFAKSTC